MNHLTDLADRQNTSLNNEFKPEILKSTSSKVLYETLVLTLEELDAANDRLEESELERERMREELERMKKFCFVDCLTGCYNRNYLNKYKSDNFDVNRDHNRIGVIMADINNLKAVNDSDGHKAGDQLIKKSAHLLRGIFRRDDSVIRLGGDEFVVICRNHNLSENFESELRTAVLNRLSKTSLDIAFGIATFNSERDASLDDTIELADSLMYENKRDQKNRIKKLGAVAVGNL